MSKKYTMLLCLAILCSQSKSMDLDQLRNDLGNLQKQLAYLNTQLGTMRIVPSLPPRETPPPTPTAPTPPPATPRPFRRPTPTPTPIIEVKIPRISISSIIALDTGYLQPLEGMPVINPKQKAEKKAQGKGILNGLLAFVKSDRYKRTDKHKIQNAVKRILAIDPLLISTAAIVLRQADVSMRENYDLMGDLYHKRIKEDVANELDKIIQRKGVALVHKGLRDDIDEALSYPVELEGEIQRARTIIELRPGTPEAGDAQSFINRIEELREWLLELLKKNQSTLKASGFEIDFYIDLFEKKGNRVYCITQVGPGFPENIYVHFIDDLRDIVEEIDDYTRGSINYPQSKKISKLQGIIVKLKAFLAYATATETQYCQICLTDDIRQIRDELQAGNFDINRTFRQIREFLENIYTKEQNEAIRDVLDNTLPQLKAAIIEKGCPISE